MAPLLEGLEDLPAADEGQADVEQDELGGAASQRVQPVAAVAAVVTRWPARSSVPARTRRSAASSSMTRIRRSRSRAWQPFWPVP
jgi:hypothetical protein